MSNFLRSTPAFTDIVADISSSSTYKELMATFGKYISEIGEYRVIISSSFGHDIPSVLTRREFSSGSSLHSIFRNEKVFIIDRKIYFDMLNYNMSKLMLYYSVSLDTQAVSYIESFLNGKNVPSDFPEVVSFVISNNVYIDAIPFLFENMSRVTNVEHKEKIASKLEAFAILKSADRNYFIKRERIRSKLSGKKIREQVDKHIQAMRLNNEDAERKGFFYDYIYVFLLKIIALKMSPQKKNSEENLLKFLYYCDEEIGAIFSHELALANEFFKKGKEQLPFFGKIQKRNPNILADIRNMAWDLFHMRIAAQGAGIKFKQHSNTLFIPCFLTFDKRLSQIAGIYSLDAAVLTPDESTIPMSMQNDWRIIFGDFKAETLYAMLNSSAAIHRRELRRATLQDRIRLITQQLESEVLQYSLPS